MLTKCLFPAAGYGTRFLPATKAMPKEMLPIVNKPLIQYGVEEAIEAGLTDIGFVSGRGKRAIEDHFDISYELEQQIAGTSKEYALKDIREIISSCSFCYTRQNEMRGLGHAILTGRNLIGDNPFGVVLADDFCIAQPGVLSQMVNLFVKYGCSIVAVEEIPNKDIQKHGVIDGEEIERGIYKISSMIEKPKPENAPSNLGIIGRYILTPHIFPILENQAPGAGGEIQLTDAISAHAKDNTVIGFKFIGRRFDCGTLNGFVDATNSVFGGMTS
tara:strand:+ start:146 stop:964 length:819 start_codon:yes stop_codon:yes gene_type:complete